MRVLFALALPLALATPSPTVPTPYPTITPAPESECNYNDYDNGPFALDCLQAEFLTQGCSMRGTSYPNEVQDEDAGSKRVYNDMTWGEVKQSMAALNGNTDACRGPPTASPTLEPTEQPTTLHPTPKPTLIPTEHTPAPTYPEDYRFIDFLGEVTGSTYSDASEAATKISEACRDAGFARQYDATQYIVKFVMGDYTDYYTYVPTVNADEGGQYHSICDMLEDPTTYKPKWAANPEGPFWEVASTDDGDKTILDTTSRTPDNRSYPHWLHSSGAGFGANSSGNKIAQGGQSYRMYISSARSYSACVPRVDPASNWVSRCTDNGTNGQLWKKDEALECQTDIDGSTNLHYALANNGFATCNDFCVYHPDFEDSMNDSTNQGQYWYFQSGANCWKPRSQYGVGGFQQCDPTHNNFQYGTERDYVKEVQATLCTEPCDFVNGWTYLSGSCYKLLSQPDYDAQSAGTNWEKAGLECQSEGGNLASIASEAENISALQMCGNDPCYLGNDADNKGEADGDWLDETQIVWANWFGGYEGASGQEDDEKYLTLQNDGTWKYDVATKNLNALCEVAANEDEVENNKKVAYWCLENNRQNDDGHALETDVYPEMDMENSGFVNADNPGQLTLNIKVPKYFFNVQVSFENSTNDAAEYRYDYDYGSSTTRWETDANTNPETDGAGECDNPMLMKLEVDWTVFNLGGAGGVQRLAQFSSDQDTQHQPQDGVTDFEGANYIFGSTMKIEAQQPIRTEVNVDDDTFVNRVATFERTVVTRAPFVIKFQKTVTITTDVDIVSTKFNYKTVAAIIQSIQYDTQYFEPPYAVIKMQIRTKSQYPYMFNDDPSSIILHPKLGETASDGGDDGVGTQNNNVGMVIEHLQNDANCTFTNPDHMREGDICTQEWMLTVTPNANVCYATGEYTIEYEADCFIGKEVCYLPRDSNNDEITTVAFTFKVQTSKFCPTVADEVDLSGTLEVTGREAFQPSGDVEDATEGQFYLQGETIHLFATTTSTKAKIVNTRVVMVELVQNLDQLVMTGYNRVPYDVNSVDLTVWTEDEAGRVADGTVRINDGSGAQEIELMTDADVFETGDTETGHTFSATEAGFKILLHAKAFPVNVDSMATKTLVATLGVDYEALGARRRRLLAVNSETDLRSRTTFNLRSFQPSLGTIKETDAATLSMELTLQRTAITRNNVRGFVQSFEDAVMTALQAESRDRVVEQQLVVEAIYSDDVPIWSRPSHGTLNAPKRRLLAAVNKKLRVDFTMVKGPMKTASVMDMLTIFDKQLRSPSSPLMRQPIFFGAVVHSVTVLETSNYRAPDMGRVQDSSSPREIKSTRDTPMGAERQESSGSRALPILAALLLVALW